MGRRRPGQAARAGAHRLDHRHRSPRRPPPSWAWAATCRSWPAPATPPRPASARARCATSRATSTSARRRGCRATCRSRRPTSCRTSPRCRRASPAATGWPPSRTPPASACRGWSTTCCTPTTPSHRARPPTTCTTGSTSWPPRSAPGSGNLIFLPWLNGERTPVDNHLHPGRLVQRLDGHRPGRPGAVGVRGRRPQHPVDAGRGREVHQAPLRAPQLRRRRRPLAAVVPDPGRRARPTHPPGGRPGAGQRARRRLLGRRSRSATCGGTTSRPRSPSPRRSSPNARNRATYDRLYGTFVDLYKKNKGLYAKLNRHSRKHPS